MTAQRDINDFEKKYANIVESVRWFRNQYYIEQNKRIDLENKVRRLEMEIECMTDGKK